MRTTIATRRDAIIAKIDATLERTGVRGWVDRGNQRNYCELTVILRREEMWLASSLVVHSEATGCYVPGAIYVVVYSGDPTTGSY